MSQEYVVPVAEFEETKYLCTCGLSATKPYCDGAHAKQGTLFKPLTLQVKDGNVSFLAIREKVLAAEATKPAEPVKPTTPKNYNGVLAFSFLTVSILAVKSLLN